MLEGRRALDTALDLARMPTLAAAVREQPLPPDTLVLIRIAAGSAETVSEAAEVTGASPDRIRDAAVFYLEQVLLAPGTDSHRILGVQPSASRQQMREHLRWLMKWLHPDRNQNDWESVFAERVLAAWRDAGNAPAEASPESTPLQVVPRQSRRRSRRASRVRWIALPLDPGAVARRKKRKKIAAAVVVATLGLTLALLPHRSPLPGWLGLAAVDTPAVPSVE